MNETIFPAKLVLSRYNPKYNPPVLVIVDGETLKDAKDAARVVSIYQNMAACGGVAYTLDLASLADVDRVVAERKAELEARANAARRPAAPAPTPAPAAEEPAALDLAYQAARAAFAGQPSTLARLDRALAIVKAGGVHDLGGSQWKVTASEGYYHVNGTCGCPDYGLRGGQWCKHRLAVALVKKTAALEKERAGRAANTPAPVAL